MHRVSEIFHNGAMMAGATMAAEPFFVVIKKREKSFVDLKPSHLIILKALLNPFCAQKTVDMRKMCTSERRRRAK
jgi:hypothetical protein